MEVDGTSILALANMLRGEGSENHDPAPKGLPRGGLNPGSINSAGTADRPRTAGKAVPKTATDEIWDEDEVEYNDDLDMDPRIMPEYDIKYSQRVSSDDMYLPSATHASIHDSDSFSISISLPKTKSVAEVDLDVTKTEINLRSPLYRLKLPLPNCVDETMGNATWERDLELLVVRVPILRDG
ncbi:hypothetical protein PhCBS80983_g00099 [Powellomyces hirtus]|uniref:PIH1D1/2/3 CS-like domain-containing protein n=1 Tax=Powellomyces hirtus TaxID=109895 RepID=A0A507EFG2_9FUNG|nr:hypothetical protein PhCBS80983_g00099 [Powellomyces hirtus]